MIELAPHAAGVVVPIHARPGARRNGFAGVHNGALRVSVTAAAEKGKANAAILALLSKSLGVPKARLEIVSGATSGKKRVLVVGMDLEALRERLAELAGQ